MPYNRIYTSFIAEHKAAFKNGRLLLAYLLIRSKARRTAGGFNLFKFCEATGLKQRAAQGLLNKMVSEGLVNQEETAGTPGPRRAKPVHYRVVSQRKLFYSSKRNLSYVLSDKELNRFSLKNISYFRALISEIEAERYKIHQRAAAKGYTKISLRDGSRDKIRNQTHTKYDQLMALECMSKLINVSRSTASNYRRKQSLVMYKWNLEIIKQDDRRFNQKGAWREFECETGKGFSIGSLVIYSPISKRISLSSKGFILKRR